MKRRLATAFIIAIMGIVDLPGGVVAQTLKDKVFEIYTDDKKLIGAGTAISFSGLILTAKHILEDTNVGGNRNSNYLLSVNVQKRGSTKFVPARVIAVHPFLDMGVLEVGSVLEISAMEIGEPNGLTEGINVTLIGHDVDTNERHLAKTGNIDEISRNGKIVLGRGVPRGFSGGPVILDNKLIAVIEHTTIDQTTAVPLGQQARDYFELVGISITGRGAARTDSIAKLAKRARHYEALLLDAQQDVEWIVDVSPSGNPGSEFSLGLRYQKRLTLQPDFQALINGEVIPRFAPHKTALIDVSDELAIRITGALKSRYKTLTKEDIMLNIEGKLQEYKLRSGKSTLPSEIEASDLIGFDVVARVNMLPAKHNNQSQKFVNIPKPRDICFFIRKKRTDAAMGKVENTSNSRCRPELLKYLDR